MDAIWKNMEEYGKSDFPTEEDVSSDSFSFSLSSPPPPVLFPYLTTRIPKSLNYGSCTDTPSPTIKNPSEKSISSESYPCTFFSLFGSYSTMLLLVRATDLCDVRTINSIVHDKSWINRRLV